MPNLTPGQKKDAADAMQILAKLIDGLLNEDISKGKYGFTLLVFEREADEGSRTNYVSNCERKDMVAALKEVTARFEGQPQQSGRA